MHGLVNKYINAGVFCDRSASVVAVDLLGKLLCAKHGEIVLKVRIIETESYYKSEKGSHASLGFTEKRKPLFMESGTIYMYYARGGDSFNLSCNGEGNAVLFKSGVHSCDLKGIEIMNRLNPLPNGTKRKENRLCSGQTLICKSLGLKVSDWNGKQFIKNKLWLEDDGYVPEKIIAAKRLGIPAGRDEQLFLRFIDNNYIKSTAKNPVTARKAVEYKIISMDDIYEEISSYAEAEGLF